MGTVTTPLTSLSGLLFITLLGMLTLSLFLTLAATALPTIVATSALLTRTVSLCLVTSGLLALNALGASGPAYNDLLAVTPVALSVSALLLLTGAVALQPWAPLSLTSLRTATPSVSTYPLFVLFTSVGATCLVSASDLVTLFLALEMQSFALYVMAAVLDRDDEKATHSGLLYFLLGGLSSSVILLGCALVYHATGCTSLEAIVALLQVSTVGDLVHTLGQPALGFTLLVVGLLFKITAAPLHHWGPDVYDGVPTSAATWLAILPKVSILGLLLVLQGGLGGGALEVTLAGHVYDAWTGLLLVSALLSLIVGTVVGLAQVRVKRLLAYSTVSHVGFLLLALAAHSQEAVEAYLLYLVVYTVTALLAFMTLLAFGYVLKGPKAGMTSLDIGRVSELAGAFASHPLLGVSLAVCLFSMAGVPPLAGFYAKQGVLYASLHAGYVFLALVAVVVSVISASYYLRVIRVVHFETGGGHPQTGTAPLTAFHSYVISACTLSLIAFMGYADFLLQSLTLLAATLYAT